MIIRSQDKEFIINFDRVDTVRLSRCTEKGVIKEHYQTNIFYETTDTRGFLGTYSTEVKAFKVLDMIEKQYASYSCRYVSDCSSYAVFQMPQDREV